MIEVVKAKKYYNRFRKNKVTAIDNTSLSFPDSGLVAILGNSGCGKTTLLNMIGGLDKPASGKIYVNGKKMNSIFSGHTDNIRNKNIGYIFQNYHLVDDMTVFENVAMPLRMLGVRKKDKLKSNVFYALEKVGLYRYRNRPATALSGGERQRVGIARAIVKNPGIIIADEPTGNLDSGNSLEIMNIIKSISKEKLVILVTHERQLAQFYADRIIEIVDGKVVNDYENIHDNTLDYRIDNKIYLRDFKVQNKYILGDMNFNFYSDESQKLEVSMVLRNGNLYIQTNGKKAEVVDTDSAIELIDDHYHALSKEEAEKNDFDYSRLDTGKKRLRYHSIYNIFNLFTNGVKKLLNYPILKKILLLGFVASSMFIMYSVSNIIGINTVTDDEFVTSNKNYLMVENGGNTMDSYQETLSIEGVRFALPTSDKINLMFDYSDYYYQTKDASDSMQASISPISALDESMLIAGRLPENEKEIVVDKMVFKNTMEYGSAPMVGIISETDFIGKQCSCCEKFNDFTVVGICDCLSPSVYINEDIMFDLVMYTNYSGYGDDNNNASIKSIKDAKGSISIYYGRQPSKDYEAIVPYDYIYTYWIGATIPGKVNGKSITIVGFYNDNGKDDEFFTNENTYRIKYLSTTKDLWIYADDKDAVTAYFNEMNMNVSDTYQRSKDEYLESINESVKTTTIIAAVVFGISLIEIFLMLRSSFLSRVKEVGTLRAIGLKKSDVYKMFLGEILAITTITAPLGFLVMSWVLKTLLKVEYFSQMYVFDLRVVLISVAIVYVFNIIAGLLPVVSTLCKTPAAILSRKDVD